MKKVVEIIFVVGVFLIAHNLVYSQPIKWMGYYDPSGFTDRGIDVVQAYDSNYVFLANTNNGIYIMKTNLYGHIIWYNFLGDSLGNGSRSMCQTSDSGFAIAGQSSTPTNSMQLIKLNKDGNILWTKKYFRKGKNSRAYSIKKTNDKGFILCGDIFPSLPNEVYVVKTDKMGNLQWENQYYGESGFDIIQSSTGYYYLIGSQPLLKLDSLGKEIWDIPLEGYKILQTENGNILVGGGNGQFSLTKIDTAGNILLDTNYFYKAYLFGMCLTKNGNIILAGGIINDSEGVDIAYTKINQTGDMIYSQFINLQEMTSELIQNVKPTIDNGLVMCGRTNYPTGNDLFDNILAIKTDSLGNTNTIVNVKENLTSLSKDFILYQNYPNPFNPSTIINYSLNKQTRIKLFITDVGGRIIKFLVNDNQRADRYEYFFDGRNFASGIYFIILQTTTSISVKKMLLLK